MSKKWSKRHEKLVIDEMLKGIDPSNIFKDYADKLPSIRTFYRRQLDDPDFKEKVDNAYTVQYQMMKAELHHLTSKTTSELKPDAEFKEAAEWKKSRIDAIKFELGKLAGTFSRRYDKKQQIEVTGETESKVTFVLPNYLEQYNAKIIDVEVKDDDNV